MFSVKTALLFVSFLAAVYIAGYFVVGRSASRLSLLAQIFSLPRQIEWHLKYGRFSEELSGLWRSDDGRLLKVVATPDQDCKILSESLPEWNYSGLWFIPGDCPAIHIPQANVPLTSRTSLHLSFFDGKLWGYLYDRFTPPRNPDQISFERVENDAVNET